MFIFCVRIMATANDDYEIRDDAGHEALAALAVHRSRIAEHHDREATTDQNLFQSMSTLEVDHRQNLLPAARERLEKEETDKHAARDSQEREKFFLSVVPDNYTVLRTLGRGHNGVVFAAHDTSGNQDVAIKFLEQRRAGHGGRRLREIAAHGVLPPHENIVKLLSRELHSAGTYDFYILELCDLSLEDWINQASQKRKEQDPENRLPPALSAADTLRLLFELCDALLLLRSFGVTHRDIKPSNVLLSMSTDDEGYSFPYQAKLADFGVADMHVVEPTKRYDNFVGIEVAGSYSVESDFRAVVATVLYAWLGVDQWKERHVRNKLLTDDGFLNKVAHLDLGPEDKLVREWFERALPMPRKETLNDVITFDDALKTLQELGEALHVQLPTLKTPTDGGDVPAFEDVIDNDTKLEKIAHFALSAVSGRRYAKDYEGAKLYLEWVQDVFKRFDKEVPDGRYSEYHFQVASAYFLPKVQQAVRDYTSMVHGNTSTKAEIKAAQQRVELALDEMDERVNMGRVFAEKAAAANPEIGSVPEANLVALTTVERVKYLQLCGEQKRALREAEKGVARLKDSLNQFADQASAPDAYTRLGELRARGLQRTAFQHCRNAYLLLKEAIVIETVGHNQFETTRLAQEAVQVCDRGLNHLQQSHQPPKSDLLEMGRCLAEALYIAGQYSRARSQCRKLYDEFGAADPFRTRVLRVLAVWVSSLRGMLSQGNGDVKEEDIRFELGFVCGMLVTINREAAAALGSNADAVANARGFLAADCSTAAKAGADPLFPRPLLPSNNFTRGQAQIALQAVENAFAARSLD